MANESPVVKHHFWILAGVTPLFVGVAFLLMLILVGGALADAQKEFKTTKDAVVGSKPQTAGELKVMAEKVDTLEENRKKLWGRSYDEQREAKVFDWPKSQKAEFMELAKQNMKFGEKFNLAGRVTDPPVLKDTFEKNYTRVSETIAPTRFASGSYLTALRTVTDWGTKQVEPEPFWLALEDFWVQRGLLEPIAKVNADAALFEDVTPKDAKDADLKRNFRTRTWELDLEVTQKGNKQMLTGQLRNRTPRLQALGVNKAMRVKVWLSDRRGSDEAPDVTFEIRGESVPGKGFINCTPQEINTVTVTKITRVIQVFDEATVPVRLVNTVELNMLDHRNKAATLELPKHIEADEAANPETPPDAGGGEGGFGPPGGLPGVPGGGRPGPALGGLGAVGAGVGGEGGEGGQNMYGGGTGSRSVKGGTIQTALLSNKRRYVKRTDDVRRMPVAVSVVIDNDYTNDLMVAYTNSPLHFQITQTQWARFKSTLPPISGPTSSGGTTIPNGPSRDGEEGLGSGRPGPGVGIPGLPGLPGIPGGLGGPLGGPGGIMTNTGSGMLPGEANANLCEFVLFGIVSLYEKVPPEEKKVDDGNPTDPTKTEPTDPVKKDPTKTEPEKKDPDTKEPEKKDPTKTEPEKKDPLPADDGKKDKAPAPTAPGK